MPHQFMQISCKKCGEYYCPVCKKKCPQCREIDVSDTKTMKIREQMRCHLVETKVKKLIKNKNMEILINGKFNDEEMEQFSEELGQKDVVVKQFFTKTIDLSEVVLEIVKIIFKDFNAISFLRDGILWTGLGLVVGKTISLIKSKKSNVKVQSRSELRFKMTSEKEVVVNISHPENPDRLFWEAVENLVTENMLNEVKTDEKISISWDDEHKKIKIIKF